MRHYGDFDANTNVVGMFTTVANGNSVGTLLANGNLVVFKDNSNANSTAGVTLTANFSGLAGLNQWNCNTAANGTFYSTGSFFHVVVNNGNVGSTSAAGYQVGSFTLRADSALKPATAGRTLTVDVGGTAQANVTVWTVGAITANITGNLTGSVGSVNGNIGGNVVGVTGDIGGNVNGNVIGSTGNILSGGANFIADTLLDRPNAIETGLTLRVASRYTVAAVAGNLTGGNTAVVVIAGATVGTARLTAAVDANGNTRTVTYS